MPGQLVVDRPVGDRPALPVTPAALGDVGIARRPDRPTVSDWIFIWSVSVIGLHLADDAVEGFRFGGPANPLVAVLCLALLPGLIAAFLSHGRVLRTAIAALMGTVAVAAGVGVYLPHLALGRAAGSDYTGALAALAGVVLVTLAAWIALRGRRRSVQIAVVPIVLFGLLLWIVYPASMAARHVAAPPANVPAASTLGLPGAVDVRFPARDGVRLAAWYVPGTNHAAVITLHGTGDSRVGTTDHLRMLASAGYAVLAVDARGHGQSAGQPNSWGWRAADTLAGAVAFLQRQPGIDPTRIAALGLSTGAIEALRAAAEGVPLAAVIADGPGPLTLGDQAVSARQLSPSWWRPVELSTLWMTMRLSTLFSGDAEATPLIDIVGQIPSPVLLIAANPDIHSATGHPPGERIIAEAYQSRMGATAALWYVDDAGHGEALRLHPDAYRSRVTAFLDNALRPSS